MRSRLACAGKEDLVKYVTNRDPSPGLGERHLSDGYFGIGNDRCATSVAISVGLGLSTSCFMLAASMENEHVKTPYVRTALEDVVGRHARQSGSGGGRRPSLVRSSSVLLHALFSLPWLIQFCSRAGGGVARSARSAG